MEPAPLPKSGAVFHSLRLEAFSFLVRLGVSPEERSLKQEVRVDIELRFIEEPSAVHSDDIAHTVCYGLLADSLGRHLYDREFHLIEKMAMDILRITREVAGPRAAAAVALRKVSPPVKNLLGGAVYRCGDFP